MAGFIKPSVNGITHNRFDAGEFVWFHEGGIDYQCVVKKIFTETDEIETIVTYYLLVLDTPLEVPFLVKNQEDLYSSREEIRKGIK